ncbi:MAG TPA: ATP-binding protein [Burkholderiales bacterium]
MRWLPRSLFGRLVLVLLPVLVVAQLIGFAIHMHERGEALSQASGLQSAQRIAGMVRLLDSLDPAQRRNIAPVLSSSALTVSLEQAALTEPEAEQTARAALFAAMLRRFLGDGRPVAVRVTDAAPSEPAPTRPLRGPGMHGGWAPPMTAAHYLGQPGLSFVAQLRLRDGALATFDSRLPEQTASWPYRLLLSLVVLLAAVIAASLVAVRWVTRPLRTLADTAEELGRNIHRPALEERGPNEVARAARAMNTMQSRLIAYLDDRTRVLAAMSHDLKTPITRLRLRAELLEDSVLKTKIAADLEETQSMVDGALDYLRGAARDEPVKPVDVTALLESLQADMQVLGGEVTIEGAAAKPLAAKPQALKRCVWNLLDNAVKYGARARIAVDDDERRLRIRVLDEGPGIPAAEMDKVFEPFYRVESSRNRATGGTGLGLSIAKGIAEDHGGSLALSNRAEGGLEATLILPRK